MHIMKILSVDTTAKTAACAVCEVKNDAIFPICSSQLNSTLTHSESILPMIDFCLKNAAVSINDIDIIAISAGPGSFTGVRIGIATVKGLAFGSEKVDCVAVSALEALSFNLDNCSEGTVVCPCMDARRNQFYNALFVKENGALKRLCEDRAVDYKDLYVELSEKYGDREVVLVGDGAELAYGLFSRSEDFGELKIVFCGYDRAFQDGVSVAKCAYYHSNEKINCNSLSPVYLRMSQAERERNERTDKV